MHASNINIYAACAVHVTIFSTGRKFHPISNFMWLHTLTSVTSFFVVSSSSSFLNRKKCRKQQGNYLPPCFLQLYQNKPCTQANHSVVKITNLLLCSLFHWMPKALFSFLHYSLSPLISDWTLLSYFFCLLSSFNVLIDAKALSSFISFPSQHWCHPALGHIREIPYSG